MRRVFQGLRAIVIASVSMLLALPSIVCTRVRRWRAKRERQRILCAAFRELLTDLPSRRAFMAQFWSGTPTMIDYIPPTNAVNSGDVVVVNNCPFVCHRPIAVGALGSLSTGGGVYIVAADAAYAPGTRVVWDTAKQQISTDVTTTAYDFGVLVGGPLFQLSDGGPTGAAGLCLVYHCPLAILQGGLDEQVASAFYANFRNLLDGGDATTNPWQRGTSFSSIAGTLTYVADRFFCIANAASAAQFSQSADANVPGFSYFFKWGRPLNNADVHPIIVGQALETLDSIRCQGQPVTFSFYAKKGGNYSGGNLTVQVVYSTTPGNDTAAHLAANSNNWLAANGGGYVINTTQALTAAETRYEFTGTVPAGCTQLGVLLTWTPTGTAAADDNVYANGFQLEVGNGATPFEHRDVQVELEICQRYCYVAGGSTGAIGTGYSTSTTAAGFYIPFPVQMRTAPTAITLNTPGDISVYTYANASVAAISAGAFASASVNGVHVTVTSTGLTSGTPYVLYVATALVGNLVFSADL